MALTDLVVVLLLGLWAERVIPAVTRALLLAGLPLIGIGIHLGAPGLQFYRGSSPLASALPPIPMRRAPASSPTDPSATPVACVSIVV